MPGPTNGILPWAGEFEGRQVRILLVDEEYGETIVVDEDGEAVDDEVAMWAYQQAVLFFYRQTRRVADG